MSAARLLALFSGVVLLASAFASVGQAAVPEGFGLRLEEHLAHGLVRYDLAQGADRAVQVAHLGPDSAAALKVVVSNDRIAEDGPRLERTSSMCLRVNCLVAVNGDFWQKASGQPYGGVIENGEMIRSPAEGHQQVWVTYDDQLGAGRIDWSGAFGTSDLDKYVVAGVNVARIPDRITLYTPAFGPRTQAGADGVELVLGAKTPGPPRLRQSSQVEIRELVVGGKAGIPADGLVLSGHGQGEALLRQVWDRLQTRQISRLGILRLVTVQNIRSSLGGSTIILSGGNQAAPGGTPFSDGRHPRTLVAWNSAGHKWLVTVDGRGAGGSLGVTLAEAAELAKSLGATEAVNLDGGGSTTFVRRGEVTNIPSDSLVSRAGSQLLALATQPGDQAVGRVERPVVNALAVVMKSQVDLAPASPDPAAPTVDGALALPVPDVNDAGSVISGTEPVLMAEPVVELASEVKAGYQARSWSMTIAPIWFWFLALAALAYRDVLPRYLGNARRYVRAHFNWGRPH